MRTKHFFLLCIAAIYVLVVGCSEKEPLPDEPVKPSITLHKKNIEYLVGSSCWFGTKTDGACGIPVHPDVFYPMIKEKAAAADPGEVIRIKFPVKPDEFSLRVVNADGEDESIGKPDQYSYKLPKKPGYYRYVVSGVWDEKNQASYYFGIQIND